SRRQDHTISPYAAAFSSARLLALTPQASIATRTTLRDDRETSLMAARAESEDSSDLHKWQCAITKNSTCVRPSADRYEIAGKFAAGATGSRLSKPLCRKLIAKSPPVRRLLRHV